MADQQELTELNQYQKLANHTAKYSSADYPFALLTEEAGEVMGKLNKYARKNGLSISTVVHLVSSAGSNVMAPKEVMELRKEVEKELGDALWAIAECATTLNIPLNQIAATNINKLADRLERNVIDGEGDNR